jgi:predicted small secreted protein
MRILTHNLVVVLLLSGFGFSGCEVFDAINKHILGIEDEETSSSDSNDNSDVNSNDDSTNNDDTNSDQPYLDENGTLTCDTGYALNEDTNTCIVVEDTTYSEFLTCDTGYTINEDTNTCIVVEDTTYSEFPTCDTGYTLNEDTNSCILDTNGTYQEFATCQTGYTLNEDTNACIEDETTTYSEFLTCDTGYTINEDTNTCIADETTTNDNSFNLTFTNSTFSDKTYLEENLTFDEEVNITVEVDPLQPSTDLEAYVGNSNLFESVTTKQNADYTYTVTVKASQSSGESNITLVLNNGYYSTDITLYISIFEQIKLSTTRNTYNNVINEDTNITVNVINMKNNPLRLTVESIKEVVDSGGTTSVIEDENGHLQAIIDGDTTISDTQAGGEFTLKVKGILTGQYIVGIKVTDTVNSSFEEKNLIINVDTKNTLFVQDLYECGIDYTVLQTQQIYNIISDDNTDDTATTSDGIDILSTYTMSSDPSDSFSTIMLFYPKSISSFGEKKGVVYFYPQTQNQQYAVISYSESLAGESYYIKYYDEDLRNIICEKNQFPSSTVDVSDTVAIDEEDDLVNPEF